MKPITFTADMAAKVAKELKTQTRRPIKFKHPLEVIDICENYDFKTGHTKNVYPITKLPPNGNVYSYGEETDIVKPKYNPGDILYVREPAEITNVSWSGLLEDLDCIDVEFGDGEIKTGIPFPKRLKFEARIGNKTPNGCFKEASRTRLEVVKVWPERLKDISEADAIAEGVYKMSCGYWAGSPHKVQGTPRCFNTPQEALWDIWDSIYGKTEFKSANNPYVWVYEFKKI